MRSLVLPSPAWRWLWSAIGALVLVFGVATSSRAELANSMFPGAIGLAGHSDPPIPPIELPLDAPVVPTVAVRDGSGQLTKVGFAASVFQTTGLTVTVNGTAPTVGGLQLTVGNEAANFSRIGNKFRGLMPLNGVEKVCVVWSVRQCSNQHNRAAQRGGWRGCPTGRTIRGDGDGGNPTKPSWSP